MNSPNSKLDLHLEDEAKITVLFSPMRDRDLNPKSWDQKVSFWTDVILSDCVDCRQAMVDVDELRAKYKRKGKSPACLTNVIEEMLRNGQLKKVSELKTEENSSWASWGYNKLVKAPIGWGISKLLPWQSEQNVDINEQFVVPSVIKSKANDLIEHHFTNESQLNIIDYKELYERSSDICPTELEFSLVMQQLCETKQVIIQNTENKNKLVKFLKQEEKKKRIDKIDEQELRIHKIRVAHMEVKKQIEELSDNVKRLAQEALVAKKQGHQKNALRLMRKRALTQHRIDELHGSMDTLDNILYRIEQAGSNEMILRAIEGGNDVLKDLTSKTSLDDVSKVMDDLADIQENQADISAQMNLTLQGTDQRASRDELEEELNQLLKEDSPRGPQGSKSEGSASKSSKSKADVVGFDLDAAETSFSGDLDVSDELKDIADILNDLKLPDVPTSPPGEKIERRETERAVS